MGRSSNKGKNQCPSFPSTKSTTLRRQQQLLKNSKSETLTNGMLNPLRIHSLWMIKSRFNHLGSKTQEMLKKNSKAGNPTDRRRSMHLASHKPMSTILLPTPIEWMKQRGIDRVHIQILLIMGQARRRHLRLTEFDHRRVFSTMVLVKPAKRSMKCMIHPRIINFRRLVRKMNRHHFDPRGMKPLMVRT